MNKLEDALHLLKLSLEESKKDPQNKVIIAGSLNLLKFHLNMYGKPLKKLVMRLETRSIVPAMR
jgi:hypothetical protein